MVAVAEPMEAPVAQVPEPAAVGEGELPLMQAPVPVAPTPAPVPAAAVASASPAKSPSSHDWRLSQRPAARPVTSSSRGDQARAPNIFQRITGLVGGGRPAVPGGAPGAMEPVAAMHPVEAAPAASAPAPAPTPLRRPAATSVPQPTIAGLDPADRVKMAREEDDLQIPAFLRRQAN
jgi:cell division protein FtsZ